MPYQIGFLPRPASSGHPLAAVVPVDRVRPGPRDAAAPAPCRNRGGAAGRDAGGDGLAGPGACPSGRPRTAPRRGGPAAAGRSRAAAEASGRALSPPPLRPAASSRSRRLPLHGRGGRRRGAGDASLARAWARAGQGAPRPVLARASAHAPQPEGDRRSVRARSYQRAARRPALRGDGAGARFRRPGAGSGSGRARPDRGGLAHARGRVQDTVRRERGAAGVGFVSTFASAALASPRSSSARRSMRLRRWLKTCAASTGSTTRLLTKIASCGSDELVSRVLAPGPERDRDRMRVDQRDIDDRRCENLRHVRVVDDRNTRRGWRLILHLCDSSAHDAGCDRL